MCQSQSQDWQHLCRCFRFNSTWDIPLGGSGYQVIIMNFREYCLLFLIFCSTETQKRTNRANILLLILSGFSNFWAEHIKNVPWTQEHCTFMCIHTCITLLVSTHFESVYNVSSRIKGYLEYYILLIFKTEILNGATL